MLAFEHDASCKDLIALSDDKHPLQHLPDIPHSLPKKPRHRHTQAQSAALNKLYEKTQHPSLEERTSLARLLGMETKTVSSWFQNKRASSRKRTRRTTIENPRDPKLGSISPVSPAVPDSYDSQSRPLDADENEDFMFNTSSHANTTFIQPKSQISFRSASILNHGHLSHNGDSTSRQDLIHSPPQQNVKRLRLRAMSPPITRGKQEGLSDTGMVAKLLQNQHHLPTKRQDHEVVSSAPLHRIDLPRVETFYDRAYSPSSSGTPTFYEHSAPPLGSHASSAPQTLSLSRTKRSSSASLPTSATGGHLPFLSCRSTPRRNSTPYANTTSRPTYPRPRRSRPEPHQLEALRNLFSRTANPSIEERTMLGREIGMEFGKVTNWFRNIRQTSRKRAGRVRGVAAATAAEDDDDGFHLGSSSASRHDTPSLRSSSPDMSEGDEDDCMDVAEHEVDRLSDAGSEEERQEAVTPPLEQSPRPFSSTSTLTHANVARTFDAAACSTEYDRKSYPDVRVEDALLLLSFALH